MPSLPELTARTVLAFRVARTGLLRDRTMADLPGWGLGFQDRGGSSRVAVGSRLTDPDELPDDWSDPDGEGPYVLAWSIRGGIVAAHRRGDLPALAAALWPADADTAAVFLQAEGARLVERGIDPLDALTRVRDAMRATVTRPMTKGAASAAVTGRVDPDLTTWCERCGATHVLEGLFRVAALPAGLGPVPGTRPVAMTTYRPKLPTPRSSAGAGALVAAYYRAYGSGTAVQAGATLGLSGRFITPLLPSELVRAGVAGHRSLVHPDLLDFDADAQEIPVRLLTSADPLLQSRDRELLVPDAADRKELFTAIGQPGALLAGDRIAGSWRTKQSGDRLQIIVRAWYKLSRSDAVAIRAEGELIGRFRGASTVQVQLES